jgi:dihydrofolate synthase/folylpolyglutamate synthase
MTLGLGNMRRLTSALGHPERRFRSAIVAGTNGKGSVTSYLAAILQNHGLKTGCYTSPHVYDVAERIRINGEPVSLDEMEAAAARIVPLYDEIGFSYFEALTAIAFINFAHHEVDIAVLETGLGGRFDATNVVEPDVSVLTSIGLDHRRILGDSEEEILREKLGVARTDVPLVSGELAPRLDAIVEDRARRLRVPRRRFDGLGRAEMTALSFDGMAADVQTPLSHYGEVPLPFIGEHQVSNALVAVGAAECLIGTLSNLDGAAALVRTAARFEVVPVRGKRVILDVAHNDDALIATTQTLSALAPRERCAIVLGLLGRKELHRFPAVVTKCARRLHLIEPVAEESLSSPQLLERLGIDAVANRGIDVVLERFFADDDAWMRFCSRLLAPASPYDAILVCGSHRTVEQLGMRLKGMS